jgi:hypothetical protein
LPTDFILKPTIDPALDHQLLLWEKEECYRFYVGNRRAYCSFLEILDLWLRAPYCEECYYDDRCAADTFPVINVNNRTAVVDHKATASKVSDEQFYYLQSRGISEENSVKLIINGYCGEIFKQLPMEFAIEANRLLDLKLEDCVG